MQAREVEVLNLQLQKMEESVLTLRVDCTKGTYVRSLARDIGEKLGMGGCVTMLRRVSTGGWPEQMMVSIEELAEKKEQALVPLRSWLRELSEVVLSDDEAKRFVQGQQIRKACNVDDQALSIILSHDLLLGTAQYHADKCLLQPQRVLPTAQERLK